MAAPRHDRGNYEEQQHGSARTREHFLAELLLSPGALPRLRGGCGGVSLDRGCLVRVDQQRLASLHSAAFVARAS